MRLGQITYAYIDGTCQGWLPRGEVIVDVARGFEYEPLRDTRHDRARPARAGAAAQALRDMNAGAGSAATPTSTSSSTQGSHREAQGEDLQRRQPAAVAVGHLFTNTEEFIGRPDASAATADDRLRDPGEPPAPRSAT